MSSQIGHFLIEFKLIAEFYFIFVYLEIGQSFQGIVAVTIKNKLRVL